jgi:prephenate dehydrogenase
MGGSLGLALKRRSICREVVGLVRREAAIREAEAAGAVDRATTDPDIALQKADIVVLATPVRTIIRQIEALAPYFSACAIVTDMGSTKQTIVRAMESLPAGIQPVGSHPMCGKEQAGMAAADPDLYQDAPWILTPSSRSTTAATRTVRDLAEAVGAKTRVLAADRHDKLVAAISHLPYVLATTLTLTVLDVAQTDPVVWDVVASGFRDTTRVAASEVSMMVDILLTNQPAVEQMLATARVQIDEFAQALADGDELTLRTLMEQAAQQRKLLY